MRQIIHLGESPMAVKDPVITLQKVTKETVWSIMDLNVTENQKSFVAPNAHSIAEAYFSKEAWFRGIFVDENPVGFVMLYADMKKPEYYLWRLMIDKDHQRKGYGYLAMEQVIAHVKALPGAKELLTSYMPGDGNPSPFYCKLGFEETGQWDKDEKILKLKL
jgi:diamine N-acetyltransferase